MIVITPELEGSQYSVSVCDGDEVVHSSVAESAEEANRLRTIWAGLEHDYLDACRRYRDADLRSTREAA